MSVHSVVGLDCMSVHSVVGLGLYVSSFSSGSRFVCQFIQ